jgi:hypothetical protein
MHAHVSKRAKPAMPPVPLGYSLPYPYGLRLAAASQASPSVADFGHVEQHASIPARGL